MKKMLVVVLLMLVALPVFAAEEEPFDYPQAYTNTVSSSPVKLELIDARRNPYFDLTTLEWHFRVQAMDASNNVVGIKDKRTGEWVAAGNPIKITAPMGAINTLFDTVSGSTMAIKLQRALLKYAANVLKP